MLMELPKNTYHLILYKVPIELPKIQGKIIWAWSFISIEIQEDFEHLYLKEQHLQQDCLIIP